MVAVTEHAITFNHSVEVAPGSNPVSGFLGWPDGLQPVVTGPQSGPVVAVDSWTSAAWPPSPGAVWVWADVGDGIVVPSDGSPALGASYGSF